jgi:hypothetical protein
VKDFDVYGGKTGTEVLHAKIFSMKWISLKYTVAVEPCFVDRKQEKRCEIVPVSFLIWIWIAQLRKVERRTELFVLARKEESV